MSSMEAFTTQASLPGLPRELRLQIYQYVFALNLNCTVLKAWKDEHTQAHGFRSVPEMNYDAKLVVPWVNLMLTCRTFACELRAFMGERSFLGKEQNTTWSIDLEAKRGGMTLGHTTWQRIPCHPKQLRVIEASYDTRRGFQAWGDGGPHGITSGLYQTLNFVIHCGPKFDCAHQLKEPIHLAELRIKVESRDDPEREYDDDHYMSLSDRETNPETTLYALGSIVGQIVNTGVLRGFVDTISVCSADKTLSWTPRDVKGRGIPEYWNRYGFEWGEKAFSER